MSVATKNPFALLDAEGPTPASPAPAKSAQQNPAPATQRDSQKPQRGGPAARGGKYYNRGGGVKKPTSKDGNPNQDAGAEEPLGEGQRRYDNTRGGRGRGGSRGGAPRGGRRPFDRHSQTGKTDSDKKLHQGWGGDDGNTELKTEQQARVDAVAEGNEWGADSAPAADWGTPAADGGAETTATAADGEKVEGGRPRREREPEEEDNTLTLDQYLAQQKEKESAILPKLEGPRQVDTDAWKDVTPLEKSGEDAYFAGKTKSAPKSRTKKEEKVFLEIDARFDRPDRGGRGRGRGGDRGRGGNRGRGGPRGGRPAGNQVVNVDDQTAFPSLS